MRDSTDVKEKKKTNPTAEEWLDGLDSDCVTGVESSTPT